MATPVFVSEEYGYDSYINLVADPENPRPDELGSHLDVGPAPCDWSVHYHMDEIKSARRERRWQHLSDEVITALVSGKTSPDLVSTEATKIAVEKLDVPPIGIHNAWQMKLLKALSDGEILIEPQWMEDYRKESLINLALSNSYPHRMAVLYELVLDSKIPIYQYESAMPNMSEMATVCVRSGDGRDRGKDVYSSWRDELSGWTPKQIAYGFGLITGQQIAINEHTLHYACAALSLPQHDTVIPLSHFMRVKEQYLEEFHEQRTEKFEDVLMDAQVIVESLKYACEWLEDESPWTELEDEYGVWNGAEDAD